VVAARPARLGLFVDVVFGAKFTQIRHEAADRGSGPHGR
jgi:hypothetical protein